MIPGRTSTVLRERSTRAYCPQSMQWGSDDQAAAAVDNERLKTVFREIFRPRLAMISVMAYSVG